MAAKKSYNRFFIIFQEEDRGYGVGPDRPPTGYAKLETKNDKGKVTIYVQNLKPFENGECLYKCYLISHHDDKDHIAYLGIMNIDDLGRGESSWECSAENAFDSKIAIDKYNAAALIVDREGMNAVVAPLVGYMSKEKFEWRSKIPAVKQKFEKLKEEVKSEEKTSSEEHGNDAVKFEEYEKQISEIVNRKEDIPEPKLAEQEEAQKEVQAEETSGGISENAETVKIEPVEEEKKIEEVREQVEEEKQIEEVREQVEEVKQTEEMHEQVGEEVKFENPEYNEKIDNEIADSKNIYIDIDNEVTDNEIVDSDTEDESIRGKHKHHKECDEIEHEKHEEHKEHEQHEEYEHEKHEYYKEGFEWGKKHDHKYEPMFGCWGEGGHPCQIDYSKYDFRHVMAKMMEDILDDYEEVDMHKHMKNCKMWKVDMKKYARDGHKMYMYPCYDLIFYPMLNNPYCNYYNYIRRHGHYLIGIMYGGRDNREVRRIIFAIPGARNIYEQPFQGMTGFKKWIPCDNKKVGGYWVMMYDPMSGRVSQPE